MSCSANAVCKKSKFSRCLAAKAQAVEHKAGSMAPHRPLTQKAHSVTHNIFDF